MHLPLPRTPTRTYLSHNAYSGISHLNHAHIVSAITLATETNKLINQYFEKKLVHRLQCLNIEANRILSYLSGKILFTKHRDR